MFIKEYWKLVIGTTLGVCFLIFGTVLWDSATEDYYNKLIDMKPLDDQFEKTDPKRTSNQKALKYRKRFN